MALPVPSSDERPRTAVFAAVPAPAPAPHAPAPFLPAHDDEDDDEDESTGRRAGLLVGLALALVVLLAVGGWLVLRDPDDGATGAPGTPSGGTGEAAAGSGPQAGDVQEVDGVRFTLEAVQVDRSCDDHAYGDTESFFETTNCTGLSRALYSAQLDGGAVVVSVSRVRMPDTATARELRALTDRNGSGNVNDLLREGVTYAGGPPELSDAEYASAVSGPTVTIVESAWAEPDSEGRNADIDQVATSGLSLPVPPFPDE